MEIANIPLWIWGAFLGFIGLMLALDLGVFHKKSHKIEMKEALAWSGVWIGLALAFNAIIFGCWHLIQPGSTYSNNDAGFAFLTGYLIEKALSIDNIFVIILIFSFFKVPEKYQHKVLFWGIVGAVVCRAIFVAAGAALLHQFFWMMVLFGLFLVFTGIKMVFVKHKTIDPDRNIFVRIVKKFLPVTSDYEGGKFLTRINGKLWATPLFIALIVVEVTDIVFAVDSIPAIFAITSNPFLVFSSNIFAILGLRALFFALSGLVEKFHFLSYGLAAILVFVGGKMIYGYLHETVLTTWPKIPVGASLGIIGTILFLSVLISVLRPLKPQTT